MHTSALIGFARATSRTFIAVLALLCLTSAGRTLAAEPAGDPTPDVLRDAVDPYNFGAERSRFLAAAGVDSELDQKEFDANAQTDRPFARSFDKWSNLRLFDKNGDGTINWFEADAYRKALREAVLGKYDQRKDKRLTNGERDAANRDLAAGRVPALQRPGSEKPNTPRVIINGQDTQQQPRVVINRGRQNWEPIEWDTDGDGKMSQEEREAYMEKSRERYQKWQAEYTRKWDADGDGQLSREERETAQKAAMEEWKKNNPEAAARWEKQQEEWKRRQQEYIEKYDTDGDGQVNGDELKAVREDQMAAWKERDPEGYERWKKQQEEYIRKWDEDGDGELSNEERQASYKAMREEAQKRYAEQIREWDKDGDGQLNQEERQAWAEHARKEAQKRQEEYIRKWDTDGDGELSREEREEAWKQQGYRGGAGGGNFGGGRFAQ